VPREKCPIFLYLLAECLSTHAPTDESRLISTPIETSAVSVGALLCPLTDKVVQVIASLSLHLLPEVAIAI
jgi:hypothetical protein